MVEAALSGVPLADLQRASERLTERYRSEIRDGGLHLSDDLSARAYLAARMPATYAAIRASLASAAELIPDFKPRNMLDIGAGPGTAVIAANDCWPGIADAELIEASPAIRKWGEAFVSRLPLDSVRWHGDDLASIKPARKFDLVTLGYLLDELSRDAITALIARLWDATAGVMIVIEPGTPEGFKRIAIARKQLLAAGGVIVAPCTHHAACPMAGGDWCHVKERVQRSRAHMHAKGASVPFEDEAYSYLAVARDGGAAGCRCGGRAVPPLRGWSVRLPAQAAGPCSLQVC